MKSPRYIFRYRGQGTPSLEEVARVQSTAGLKVVDISDRMLLVELSEGVPEIPGWEAHPEIFGYELTDTRGLTFGQHRPMRWATPSHKTDPPSSSSTGWVDQNTIYLDGMSNLPVVVGRVVERQAKVKPDRKKAKDAKKARKRQRRHGN